MNSLKFREQSIGDIKPNPLLLGLVVVEINPTELCNRTCTFCPRSDSSIYPNQNKHMSIETASLLKEQLRVNNFEGYVCVAGYGEPLLTINILDIIKELSYHYIELITNGDNILKNKFTIEQLFSSGVSRILISDYDNNEQLHVLETQYKNIKVRKYLDDGKDHFSEYNFSNRGGTLWSLNSPISRSCYIPSYKAMIDWNGDVLLCSHDWVKKRIFGNIHNRGISEIWSSPEFIETRIALINGDRHKYSPCNNCSVNGTIMGKKYADYWIKK